MAKTFSILAVPTPVPLMTLEHNQCMPCWDCVSLN